MTTLVDAAARSLVIGAGATAVLDLWSLYVATAFRIRGLDYGLLGRRLGHLGRGRLHHDGIAASPPIRGERPLGWVAHYATGVLFAGALLAMCGPGWAQSPTLAPALAVGLATVVFPFLVLQPAMGGGFAASRSPDRVAARLRSLGTHLVFGLGLYLTAWAAAQLRF